MQKLCVFLDRDERAIEKNVVFKLILWFAAVVTTFSILAVFILLEKYKTVSGLFNLRERSNPVGIASAVETRATRSQSSRFRWTLIHGARCSDSHDKP